MKNLSRGNRRMARLVRIVGTRSLRDFILSPALELTGSFFPLKEIFKPEIAFKKN
jgi:hypothetical protein